MFRFSAIIHFARVLNPLKLSRLRSVTTYFIKLLDSHGSLGKPGGDFQFAAQRLDDAAERGNLHVRLVLQLGQTRLFDAERSTSSSNDLAMLPIRSFLPVRNHCKVKYILGFIS